MLMTMTTQKHSQRQHARRIAPLLPPLPVEIEPPEIESDPELAAAWHALVLHWVATVPGYREELRARVDRASRRRELAWRRIANQQARRELSATRVGALPPPSRLDSRSGDSRLALCREIARPVGKQPEGADQG